MHRLITIVLACSLSACGADIVGAAATGAASKAEEIKQAKKTEAQIQQRLDEAAQTAKKRDEDADKAAN